MRTKLEEHGYALADACALFNFEDGCKGQGLKMEVYSQGYRDRLKICESVLSVCCSNQYICTVPLTGACSRATCYIQTLKPKLAVADLKRVLALEPGNATVKTQLDTTQKLVRRIEFEKAIEVGEEKSAVVRCLEIIAEGTVPPPFFPSVCD
jgi:hypothetical protein